MSIIYKDLVNAGIEGQCVFLDMTRIPKMCNCLAVGLSVFQDNVFSDGIDKMVVAMDDDEKVALLNFMMRSTELHDRVAFMGKSDNLAYAVTSWFSLKNHEGNS